MPSIVELKQERERIKNEMRTLNETAESANRDLEGQETETFGRLEGEFKSLTGRISRQEQIEQRDRDAAGAPQSDPEQAEERESLSDQFRELARGDRRSLNVNFTDADVARSKRDLEKATDAAGGHTVPETFVSRLYEYLTERSAIRQTNVTVLTTGSGEKMLFPKVTKHSGAAWAPEGSTLGQDDPEFGQAELEAHKLANMIKLSSELVADTGVDLLDFIARDAGRALGEKSGAAYLTGDGASKPSGILQDTTAGVTAAEAEGLDAEELIKLYFSVIDPYRRNGYWVMNDSTLAKVAVLKDGDGRYLLDPLVSGNPQTIRGRPVVTDHNMPAAEADAKSIIFGDFSSYYIRDVGSMRFERSDQFAFDTDEIVFRSIMRTDGKLVDTTGAVKHLAQAPAA